MAGRIDICCILLPLALLIWIIFVSFQFFWWVVGCLCACSFFFSSWQKLLYKQKFISKKRLSVGTKTKMRIAGLFRVFTMHLQQINRFSFHVILSDWLCIAMSMLRYGSPSPLHTHISFYLAHFINATQFPNFHTKLTAPYYFITFSIFQSEG